MAVEFKCPFCKSGTVWRKGFQPSVTGKKQRFVCYDCGKTFYRPAPAKPKRVRKPKKAE